jgi:hypothetical protein
MSFVPGFVGVVITLSTLAPVVPVGAQIPADSGAFVMRLGRDTLKVERFVFRDGVLRSESVRRAAGVELQLVDAMLNTDGSIARVQTRLYDWPVDSAERPTDGSLAYVDGDSTILELGLPPNVQRAAYPGRAHILGLGVYPFVFALYVPLATYAPTRVGDTLVLQQMTSTVGLRRLTVRRAAPDLVTAQSTVMGMMRMRVDGTGRLRGLDGIGSSMNFQGERVAWVDLDSVARSFDRMNRATGAIAAVSPRDTVVTTVGGARLTVDYSRPSTRGRVVFGGIVPWNRVWRTGANFATHFTADRALAFGSAVVPPGKYTLYTVPSEEGWTLIVSRKTGQWGTEYDPSQDLVRIPMGARRLATPVEQFTIVLEPRGSGGILRLMWDFIEANAHFSVR